MNKEHTADGSITIQGCPVQGCPWSTNGCEDSTKIELKILDLESQWLLVCGPFTKLNWVLAIGLNIEEDCRYIDIDIDIYI